VDEKARAQLTVCNNRRFIGDLFTLDNVLIVRSKEFSLNEATWLHTHHLNI
jgi:hypothetical protein